MTYGNKNVILLSYNNYYNRTLKYYSNTQDYLKYQIGNTLNNINFNPNDGVQTELVINWTFDIPDYLLVVSPDQEQSIDSRWYVIDGVRLRSGQLRLSLFRDLLADYYEEISKAPIFVEKGILPNGNNLIYNSENMTYSQVKTKELLIQDPSESAWLVGYCASDNDLSYTTTEGETPQRVYYGSTNYSENTNITTIEDSTQWAYYNNSSLVDAPEALLKIEQGWYNVVSNMRTPGSGPNYFKTTEFLASDYPVQNWQNINTIQQISQNYPFGYYFPSVDENYALPDELRNANSGYYIDRQSLDTPNVVEFFEPLRKHRTSAQIADIIASNYNIKNPETLGLQDKIFFFNDLQRAYKVNLKPMEPVAKFYSVPTGTSLFVEMKNLLDINQEESNITGTPNNTTFYMCAGCQEYLVEMIPVAIDLTRLDFAPASTRQHLMDAPYDMFAIPFSPIKIQSVIDGRLGTYIQQVNTEAVFSCVQELARKQGVGSDNKPIYDIQLLPFCPIPDAIVSPGVVRIPGVDTRASYGKTFTNISSGTLNDGVWQEKEQVGVVFYCSSSSFTNWTQYTDPTILSNKKIRSETELYRLCSPNGNGGFDWNQVKNGGFERGIIRFNISCSYKPFTPFIQVSPAFGGLYGQTFNKDNRGLICGGDFSMPIITDAWVSYQQQNRNYQAIFDRQIENMETHQYYEKINQIANVATGAIGGGISGAMVGAMAGNVPGAIIGGVLGAGASTAGGIADIVISDKLRAEQIDFTKDQFGYQLGNIRALPNGLAKVSAFNINNKIFPVLEYYVATAEEIEALNKKIKYDGMTVMSIFENGLEVFAENKPADFIVSISDTLPTGTVSWDKVYFKGRLVRLDNLVEDYHVSREIANELNKGVYI